MYLDSPLQKEQSMQPHNVTDSYQESNRSAALLALWTIAWVATLALARFGPERLWNDTPVASWIAVLLNLIVGIGWIVIHARFLREIDELQRKIMQDSLAVTLGAGMVGGFSYIVADAAGIISSRDVNIAVFPVALAVVYVISIAAGYIRFR